MTCSLNKHKICLQKTQKSLGIKAQYALTPCIYNIKIIRNII